MDLTHLLLQIGVSVKIIHRTVTNSADLRILMRQLESSAVSSGPTLYANGAIWSIVLKGLNKRKDEGLLVYVLL